MTSPPPPIGPLRRAAIVVAYVLAFWGALPALLWWAGGVADQLLALPALPGAPWLAVGAALAILGWGWTFWAIGALWRYGRGLPISHLPPTRLVTEGPYRVMKHPIYVGYTIGFAGVGLLAGSLGRGVVAPLLLWLAWRLYARLLEEPGLVRRFGASWRRYTAATAGGVVLEKLYCDLVTPEGELWVVYVSRSRVLGVRQRAAGVERYLPDGTREVFHARAPLPGLDAALGGVDLSLAEGTLSLRYEPQAPPWEPDSPIEGLRWRVVIPRARGHLRATLGGREVEARGLGYADRVTLSRSPRALGLRDLRWGRVHLPDATWIWDEVVRGAGAWRTLAVFDGAGARREPAEFVLDDGDASGTVRAGDETVSLTPVRTTHEGDALDAERFPSALERSAARAWAGPIHERRRLSRAGAHGWAVHEVVRFGR